MRKKLVVATLIGLGLIMVLLFGLRLTRAIRHWGGPPHPQPRATTTDVELIRDWMTIPYIAKTYGVPDRMLFRELRIPDEGNREKSLKELNDEYFPEQAGFVLDEVKKAINDHRPPTPPTAPAP